MKLEVVWFKAKFTYINTQTVSVFYSQAALADVGHASQKKEISEDLLKIMLKRCVNLQVRCQTL